MRKFRVSVAMERCVDIYIEAETAEQAQKKAMDKRLWRGAPDDAWCDGHMGSERIDSCVEADADGVFDA